MERYPEHRFSCTQAQQFKWLEQLYPLLYQRLKAKVETGQFRESNQLGAVVASITLSIYVCIAEPVGATWVEMDTNLPSGEALCRQFLYGQRYFKSRFGITSPTFVLPDTCEFTLKPAFNHDSVLKRRSQSATPRNCLKLLDSRVAPISSLRSCRGTACKLPARLHDFNSC